MTLSLGVAELSESYIGHDYPRSADQMTDINCFAVIKIADARLYKAKEDGRNQVVDS